MIAEILSMPDAKDDIPQEKISKLAETTRINYLNAVCDAVWESLSVSSPNLSDRFHIALLSPRIAGLPDEFTTEYLSAHGISAGVVFGLHRLQGKERMKTAAYCAFLMAYYLFIALTPPASFELAEFYIDRALEWDETPEYRQWKAIIDEGN